MPKKISITINESADFLNKAYSRTTSRLQQDRIKTLLFLVEKKYHYQSNIAKKLGRTEKTIRDWLKLYVSEGFSSLITVKSGGNNTRTLSDKAITLIEEKVTDASTTITSYVELQLLIEEQLNEKIVYGALYSHCRRKFRTKLKVARKSHHKKDPNAEAFFKNAKRTV
jgi:transposase